MATAEEQAATAAALAAQRLIARQQAAVTELRRRVEVFIRRAWRGLRDWRNPSISIFLALVLPVIRGGQRQVASITDAQLSRLYSEVTGRPIRLAAVPTASVTDLRAAEPGEVYERPFHDVWRALSDGKSLEEAVQVGEDRAVELAVTDLQLAKTHAAQQVLQQQPGVVGYRRVLKGPESCAMCVVASTQRYHIADLMPIHPGCDCEVDPIIGDFDPGRVIDEDRLAKAHAAVMERLGISDSGARNPDYRKLLITHEHGDIGPVIAVRGEHFTGPADLNKSS